MCSIIVYWHDHTGGWAWGWRGMEGKHLSSHFWDTLRQCFSLAPPPPHTEALPTPMTCACTLPLVGDLEVMLECNLFEHYPAIGTKVAGPTFSSLCSCVSELFSSQGGYCSSCRLDDIMRSLKWTPWLSFSSSAVRSQSTWAKGLCRSIKHHYCHTCTIYLITHFVTVWSNRSHICVILPSCSSELIISFIKVVHNLWFKHLVGRILLARRIFATMSAVMAQ